MASSSFRDSMNSLGWSRRADADIPVRTGSSTPILSKLQSYNPFGANGYVRLPTTEGESVGAPLPARTRQEEEEAWFALSRWDRILVFGGLNLMAAALIVICFTLFPFLALNVTKFAILWTMASVLFLASWAVMMGPMSYARHLLSTPRLPFTGAYFGSIAMTLYFSLGLHSKLLTLVSSLLQLACAGWYLVSYFPMGSTGLRWGSRFATNRITAWMSG